MKNRARTRRRVAVVLGACAAVAIVGGGGVRAADEAAASPSATFRKYCFQCHGNAASTAGVNLERLIASPSMGDGFQAWDKVAAALDQRRMPPKGMPQPSDEQRHRAVTWIRAELDSFVKKHAGDPGRVTVRRLTSGEYGYTIQDLTGLDLDVGIDGSSDSVGGEGFTNFGDVQFMQDANLERYLKAAKTVADHAVIGAGPISFFTSPGKTGFELAAITRIKDIYTTHGFRTVSGEGGIPFGLDKYGKALYVAWRYRHRAALGEPKATLPELAAREGITARFAEHIWSVMNKPVLGYPSSEVAARWRRLPAQAAAARTECEAIEKYLTTWPSWLFARGDVAAGGAGDESPLMFNDKSLSVEAKHHFVFNRGGRGGGAFRLPVPAGPAKVYLNMAQVNPAAHGKPVVIWRNATLAYRIGTPGRAPGATAAQAVAGQRPRGAPTGPKMPLKTVIGEEAAKQLGFGNSIDGSPVGPGDFAADASVSFEVPMPQGAFSFELQIDAETGSDRDQVFRITISDRADGGARGIPTRALVGDPQSDGYRTFKAGVLELAELLPPNSNSEPTPADKDPIPEPFDSAFNVPEHDEFDTRVKYVRDDRFVYQNMLDDATRKRLDQAWSDLYASFEYHDNYLALIAQHFSLDLKGKHIGDLDEAQLEAIAPAQRKFVEPLVTQYKAAMKEQAAARPRHLEDCLNFASRAWRRPLTETEKQNLRSFYDKMLSEDPDHRKAIRAVLTRILVAPAFLYRMEAAANTAPVRPLTGFEMATRLSFFLWSSIPDDELRRAAAAGELNNPQLIQRQVKRMLADPKARRLSTEFFGQWLGFYHFDQHKGVDTSRFPEFTNDVKEAMYDEAVTFFEHIIRKDRPVREMLFAGYTFLNEKLARFYGVKKEVKSKDRVELVDNAGEFQRGGLLRLGAVLTATSAPLRTSPVKRGDWVLRRILGTAVPPPPADAGSIPADDKLFGGLSLREKLEAHKRNATCANCHSRIDPLGFPLEHYDSTGRWREQYADGKAIYDAGTTADQKEISGVNGLLDYLRGKEDQVLRTLAYKLTGYALGRTVQASDLPLINRMIAHGGDASIGQLASEIAISRQFRDHLGREESPVQRASVSTKKVGPR